MKILIAISLFLTLDLTFGANQTSTHPTTPTPSTVAAITTKPTKVIFFQSTNRPRLVWNVSEAVTQFLTGYSNTVQNIHFDFYKFKARTIQNFLDTTIPSMEDLRNDVTELINLNEQRGGGLAALARVKSGAEFVDGKMSRSERKFERHEILNQEFNDFVFETTNHFKNFRMHFQSIFDNEVASLNTRTSDSNSGPCGGLIDLSLASVTRLNYTVTDRQSISCVYAVWTAVQDQIKITNLRVDGESSLSIHYYDHNTQRMRQVSNIEMEEVRLDHSMVFLVFSSSATRIGLSHPNGFRLEIQAAGSHKLNIPPVVKFLPDLIPDNDTASTYIYPESGKYYGNNEKIFFISQPSQHRQISLSILDLELQVNSTGPCCDSLAAFTFSNNYNQFQFRKLYMGNFIPSFAEEIYGSPDQPVLLYFESDANVINKGFTISYRNK